MDSDDHSAQRSDCMLGNGWSEADDTHSTIHNIFDEYSVVQSPLGTYARPCLDDSILELLLAPHPKHTYPLFEVKYQDQYRHIDIVQLEKPVVEGPLSG